MPKQKCCIENCENFEEQKYYLYRGSEQKKEELRGVDPATLRICRVHYRTALKEFQEQQAANQETDSSPPPSPLPTSQAPPPQQSPTPSLHKTLIAPVYITLEMDGKQTKECILWNLFDDGVTPDSFAEHTCRELSMGAQSDPSPLLAVALAASIKKQIDSAMAAYGHSLGRERAALQRDLAFDKSITLVKLDIRRGSEILSDCFEWDVCSEHNDPIEFATRTCEDAGIPKDWVPWIAGAIHEQSNLHIKAMLDGRAPNRKPGRLTLDGSVRQPDEWYKFQPALRSATSEETERMERMADREARHRRRTLELAASSKRARGAE